MAVCCTQAKYFRRGLLILLPLAVSLAYFAGYDHLVRQPIENRCGAASDFAATVCDWPQATERGARVTVELEGYHRARAVLYGEAELLAARPGDTVTGTAQWQSAVHFNSDDVTHFNARGVYALLYGREDVRLSAGMGMPCAGCPSGRVKLSARRWPLSGMTRVSADF